MNPIDSPYVLILIGADAMCASIAAYVWLKHRNYSETIPLVLLLLGITEWIAATLGGMLDLDLSRKMLWAQIEYIGVVSVPLMVLVYVLRHSGSRRPLTARQLVGLALIPAATLVLAWTNGNRGLIWARYVPYLENGLAFSDKTYGPGFWIYWAYSYLLLLTATAITVRAIMQSARLFRWQNILILIGILAPWIGNLLYVLHLDPLNNFDLTPLAFGITGIMLAFGMFRWRLFDIKPIAQAAVIAGMTDGVMILDPQNRIVDLNSAAQAILDLDAQMSVGKPVEQILASRLPAGERFRRMEEKTVEIQLSRGGENRDFELSNSPFYEEQGSLGGRLIFLRDVTDQKRLRTKLRDAERERAETLLAQSENKYATLFQNMSVGVIYQSADGNVIDMNPAAERILGMERAQIGDLASIRANIKTIREDGSDFPPEDHPGMVSLRTGKPLRNQMMGVYFPDENNYHWINIHTVPQFKPGEEKTYQVFIILDDVTERKRAEVTLQALSARQTALLSAIPDIIMEVDVNKHYLWANQAGLDFFGNDVLGKEAAHYFEGDQETYTAVQPIFRGGEDVIYVESWQRRKDDEKRLLAWWCRVLKDKQGRVTGALSSAHDITERKRAEELLRESEEKFKYVFDNSVVGKSITLLSGEMHANKALCEMLGYSPEELQNKKWQKITHPDDIDLTQKEVNSLHSGEKASVRFAKRYIHKNGSIVWGDVSTSLRRDGQGTPLYLMTTLVDITTRIQAEEALRQSEKRFRALIENSADAISLLNANGTVMYNSPSYERMLGYTGEERIGRNTFELVDPDDRENLLHLFAGILQKPEQVMVPPIRIRHADGSWHWIEGIANNLLAEPGVQAIVVNFRDITERRRAEEALRESETNFRTLAENAGEGVLITGAGGVHLFANRAAAEITGYSVDELLHLNAKNLAQPDEAPKIMERLEKRLAGENPPARYETAIVSNQGLKIPVEINSNKTVWEGRPADIVFIMDITERKRVEEALKNTMADLERSNQELEQFAYVASHDLQEPLRMVSSYTKLLGERYRGKLDQDADEFIGYAVDGASHMQRLINDLLAYSRVGTRGKPPESVPADSALDQALENLKFAIEEDKAKVTREPLPTVMVDDVQLSQVFQNLIANAIKFRGDDPPRIRIAAEAREKEWVFSVRDNGIGIDPQYLERIFVIFQRLNPRGKYPGTGIGLAMCQKIIQRHGGRIWAESKPGEGSTFFFTLPRLGGK